MKINRRKLKATIYGLMATKLRHEVLDAQLETEEEITAAHQIQMRIAEELEKKAERLKISK